MPHVKSLLNMSCLFVKVFVNDLAVELLQGAQRSANSYLAVDHGRHSSDFALSQLIESLSFHFQCKIRFHVDWGRVVRSENMALRVRLEVYHHDLVLVSHLVGNNFVTILHHFVPFFVNWRTENVIHVAKVIWVLGSHFSEVVLIKQLSSCRFDSLTLPFPGSLQVKWRLMDEVSNFMSQVLVDWSICWVIHLPDLDLRF